MPIGSVILEGTWGHPRIKLGSRRKATCLSIFGQGCVSQPITRSHSSRHSGGGPILGRGSARLIGALWDLGSPDFQATPNGIRGHLGIKPSPRKRRHRHPLAAGDASVGPCPGVIRVAIREVAPSWGGFQQVRLVLSGTWVHPAIQLRQTELGATRESGTWGHPRIKPGPGIKAISTSVCCRGCKSQATNRSHSGGGPNWVLAGVIRVEAPSRSWGLHLGGGPISGRGSAPLLGTL